MVGSAVTSARRDAPHTPGAPRLVLYALDLPAANPHDIPLRGISLEVRAGEIVGIAGVAGNGQSELMAAIIGERLATNPGDIRIGATVCGRLGAASRRSLGLATVPEERNGHAAMPGFTLAENMLLTGRERAGLARFGMVRAGATRDFAARIVATFDVRAGSPEARAGSLSGGNLQKFVMGRKILQEPAVLVAAQPT